MFICFCVLFGKCSIFEVKLYIAYNIIRAVNGTLTCRPCRSGVHLNSFFRSATSCNLSHSHSPPPPPPFSCSNFQNPKICPNKFCEQFLLCNLNYEDNSPSVTHNFIILISESVVEVYATHATTSSPH